MKSFIVIATKGRAKETYVLLNYLLKQTYPIQKIMIVGSESKDVENLEIHPLVISKSAFIEISPKAGLTIQRNVGLNALKEFTDNLSTQEWFVTFFDDDYRPNENWLNYCAQVFKDNFNIIGLTGRVLADGVHGNGYSEGEAEQFLSEENQQGQPGAAFNESAWLYGCNMAVRGGFANDERFDENLPLYGWQEDMDYASRALRQGNLAYAPMCYGVHLGVSSGRTSGVKFGYSQIANPIYLYKKGTMSSKKMMTLMSRNIASNVIKTITINRKKDYFGRLVGNLKAALDLVKGKCHPLNVLSL